MGPPLDGRGALALFAVLCLTLAGMVLPAPLLRDAGLLLLGIGAGVAGWLWWRGRQR